jgi:hypothetical protein
MGGQNLVSSSSLGELDNFGGPTFGPEQQLAGWLYQKNGLRFS